MTGNGRKSDFIIAVDNETPPLINLVGIESPGLSAALAIARHVARTALHSKAVQSVQGSIRPHLTTPRMC